jgi:GDP-mannose 6-dehydrogenase
VKIAIFGLGYVGATNAACLAKLGHFVVGIDINEAKVATLSAGKSPIVEPLIAEMIAEAHRAGRVSATGSVEQALGDADIAVVCVGTPSQEGGAIEPRYLIRVTEQIAQERKRLGRTIPIFVRSTGLPSVHHILIGILTDIIGSTQPIAYCVHPEFLREGQAVDDFFHPPKIVYGVTDEAVRSVIAAIYPGLEAPTEITSPAAAALVKYADNCFHALKVTFANEIGRLAWSFGIDARDVMRIFCLDTKLNISEKYLKPGLPFGGSCLPKDVKAVNAWSRELDIQLPMLNELVRSNRHQVDSIVERLAAFNAKKVGLFGLAFKDDTDDLRESPMLTIVEKLRSQNIQCCVFDPMVNPAALGTIAAERPGLRDLPSWLTADGEALIASSDLVVIARKKIGIDFQTARWRADAKIFDLVGVDPPIEAERVVGLYW